MNERMQNLADVWGVVLSADKWKQIEILQPISQWKIKRSCIYLSQEKQIFCY